MQSFFRPTHEQPFEIADVGMSGASGKNNVLKIMIMGDTQDWGATPARGASLKGVQAYLGRWGLAQPSLTGTSPI